MKFYDRKKEIEILRRNWEKSAKHSLFTVMIGRRRIGKTLLLLKTEQEQRNSKRLLRKYWDFMYMVEWRLLHSSSSKS